MSIAGRPLRLLPWTEPDGRPCYLSADGVGTGPVSRLADRVESVQLVMAGRLLDEAFDAFAEPEPEPKPEAKAKAKADGLDVDGLTARLTEALRDTLLIAESRGVRLGLSELDFGDGDGDGDP